jgi:hypothetical protein
MHAAAPDPRIDVSLRFLSLLVSGAIALALLWYLYVLVGPWLDFKRWRDLAPIVELDPLSTRGTAVAADDVGPPASAARWDASWTGPPMQLIAPAFTVFRCELRGRVTYSDKPCEHGGVRVVRLPRN